MAEKETKKTKQGKKKKRKEPDRQKIRILNKGVPRPKR